MQQEGVDGILGVGLANDTVAAGALLVRGMGLSCIGIPSISAAYGVPGMIW